MLVRVTRAYKTELDLNNAHVTACKQHAGAARWVYNWGLRRKRQAYRSTGTSPSAIELHRELNALKRAELPWLSQVSTWVSTCAPQEALRHLDQAFDHLFRRCRLKRAGQLWGKVGLKTKQRGLGGLRLTGTIVVEAQTIHPPRLGRLRLKARGYLPTLGSTILSATVSEQAGRW